MPTALDQGSTRSWPGADYVSALPPDYDRDPDRAASWDPSWVVGSGAYVGSGERLTAVGASPVLDLGCSAGGFAEQLAREANWIGVDNSPTQLARAPRPVVRADVRRLPFRDGGFGAVAAHWMLYHFDSPAAVISEARRVLRDKGLFVASTPARDSDPDLVPEGYPATTFDAEDAPEIVASVFRADAVAVERWDGPFNVLPDRAAVVAFARHHQLPASVVDHVSTPLTLTKRGALVWARRSSP